MLMVVSSARLGSVEICVCQRRQRARQYGQRLQQPPSARGALSLIKGALYRVSHIAPSTAVSPLGADGSQSRSSLFDLKRFSKPLELASTIACHCALWT